MLAAALRTGMMTETWGSPAEPLPTRPTYGWGQQRLAGCRTIAWSDWSFSVEEVEKTVAGSTTLPRGSGGSYRDRTDDIHGVSVALYQLS